MHINIDGHGQIKLKIVRNVKSKSVRMRLTKKSGGLELSITAPYLIGDNQIANFIANNEDWIKKQILKVNDSGNLSINNDEVLTIFGIEWKLLLVERLNPETKVFLDEKDKIIHIFHPKNASLDELKAALREKLRGIAKTTISNQTKILAKEFGFAYGRIKIAEQSSRWGSCSSQGNLNFNWKLILAPVEVCKYVIIHELAHLKQQNHSQLFWDLVESMDKNFRAHRIWLKRNGHTLNI